ncbi:MAG: PQQ-binding-like beta-propeller repeat protein [Armatimonadetes bacterium]|nr:PQQ-binding-like beta-propeller repeat protein [Armatimonadota bacterium]
MRRFALLLVVACVMAAAAEDLKPGDRLPDCHKVPLLTLGAEYRPHYDQVPSLESLLLSDGVLVVHFTSPRPPRNAPFRTWLGEEVAALGKACLTAPYRTRAVVVVPLGDKGRRDALTVLANSPDKPWQGQDRVDLFYEPTWPRPGLYRTFRPGAAEDEAHGLTLPLTVVLGPHREIIALRGSGEGGELYDWLVRSLPAQLITAPRPPSGTASLPAGPADWPAFRRNAGHQAESPAVPNTLPYLYRAWQAEAGQTFASPAVADGTVYALTDEDGLRSYALADGQAGETFELDSAASAKLPPDMKPGEQAGAIGPHVWSSPVVAGDRLYLATGAGEVICLSRADFAPLWRRSLGGLVTSSPLVAEGALYLGSRGGAVYALDAADGALLWRFQTGGEVSSSPALSAGTLLVGSGDRRLYALDARSGEERWSLETSGAVDSSPTVAGDAVVVGSFDGCVYSARLADGKLNWRCPLGGWVHSSAAVSDDTVYIGTVNYPRTLTPRFAWLDLRSGAVKASFDMPDAVYSSPTLWDALVLVGCRDGKLYAFDRTGRQSQPLWTFATGDHLHASPVVVGSTVLLHSTDGQLYALRSARPIEAWTAEEVTPRWFMAALAKQLHQGSAELIARASAGAVGESYRLPDFDTLYSAVKAQVANPERRTRVLPRDVPSDHPGAPYIEYVLTAGLLSGYPDATFRPTEPPTHSELAGALAGVLDWISRPDYVWRVLKDRDLATGNANVEVKLEPIAGRGRRKPSDLPDGHWAAGRIARLAELGALQLDENNAFGGEVQVTLSHARTQWTLISQALRVTRTK